MPPRRPELFPEPAAISLEIVRDRRQHHEMVVVDTETVDKLCAQHRVTRARIVARDACDFVEAEKCHLRYIEAETVIYLCDKTVYIARSAPGRETNDGMRVGGDGIDDRPCGGQVKLMLIVCDCYIHDIELLRFFEYSVMATAAAQEGRHGPGRGVSEPHRW